MVTKINLVFSVAFLPNSNLGDIKKTNTGGFCLLGDFVLRIISYVILSGGGGVYTGDLVRER